jgi:hypothetical protein
MHDLVLVLVSVKSLVAEQPACAGGLFQRTANTCMRKLDLAERVGWHLTRRAGTDQRKKLERWLANVIYLDFATRGADKNQSRYDKNTIYRSKQLIPPNSPFRVLGAMPGQILRLVSAVGRKPTAVRTAN